jgi:hypothetical protein
VWRTADKSQRRPNCMDRIDLEVANQPEREPQTGQ